MLSLINKKCNGSDEIHNLIKDIRNLIKDVRNLIKDILNN